MEKEFEDFINYIESNYAKPDPNKLETYSLDLTENNVLEKRAKLRKLRPQRDKIYSELQKIYNQDIELFRKLAYTLQEGFKYIAEDNAPFHQIETIYRKTKKNIENHLAEYLKKQNEKLLQADPYFKHYPFSVTLDPHPYDSPNPPKMGKTPELKNALIKDLSDSLKVQFPEVPDRSKLISEILHSFYLIFMDPRSIRKHF